jgi:trigger factor
LPGFHDQIVGMSAGEDKTFELTYPEDDFEENVAGKEATFTVHLSSVKEQDLPPLDDDLAMMVGDYDTIEELRDSVREALETEASTKAESEYVDSVLEAMIEAADKIEYPQQAIDREAELALDQMERNLATSGIKMEAYLSMLGKTREAYSAELRPAAEERLKKRLVMVEVARQEEIQPTDEEIEAEIDRASEAQGENAGQMRQLLESPQGRMSVADDIIGTKTTDLIVEIAKGEAVFEAAEEEAEADVEAGAEAPEQDAEVEAAEASDEEAEDEAQAEAPIEEGADADES